ncbi:MAG: HAMP domain-containing sensor histidine kinase, partial [Candidatus Thermoplasmatota archaeon]
KKRVDDEHLVELIEVLEKNTDYMKKLVKKTIELAKLNSSKIDFDFEQTDLKEEIDKLLRKNELFFQENNVVVENRVDEDIRINVDKLRFGELLDNLLNNAVKYSNKNDARVVIDAEEKKDEVIVSVKDNGIGMTKDQIDKLFNEFYKADHSRHDFDSSGLGMPICKKIVEKHGGSIWAESPGLGKGSTFYFSIPTIKNENS